MTNDGRILKELVKRCDGKASRTPGPPLDSAG